MDSAVWQAGKIISKSKGSKEKAMLSLIKHFVEKVGIMRAYAEKLASELTFCLGSDIDFYEVYDRYKGC